MQKSSDDQAKILSAIKRMEASLRVEIKKGDKSLRQEILKVEERAESIEEGQGDVRKKLEILQNTLDGFVGVVDNLRTDNVVGANQFRDHEKRISKLESRVQAA